MPPRTHPILFAATFGRLLRVDTATGRADVLHEGAGKYYGLAPADDEGPASGWLAVVSRPSSKEDADRTDYLLVVETSSSRVLVRRPLTSLDTHQIVRAGRTLFVADTERGLVRVHEWPSLRELPPIAGFAHEHHVNSLHVAGRSLFVMCHNKGPSWIARVDLATARIAERWEGIGENAHDLAPVPGAMIVCDSKGGALVRARLARGGEATVTRLWERPGCFTKGLVVENGVAWFGVSAAAERAARAKVACDIVGVDLAGAREVARFSLPTAGLINALATERSLSRQREPAAVSL